MKTEITTPLLFIILNILPAIGQNNAANNLTTKNGIPDSVQTWMKEKIANATEKEALPDYQMDTFFDKRPAHLVGYIKGYSSQLGFKTGIVYTNNEITFDFHPVAFTIHPDGCFETDIPMIHPACIYLSIEDQLIHYYVEPGRTSGIVLDWAKFLASHQLLNDEQNMKGVSFFGILAKINEDLKKVELKSQTYILNWKKYSPKEYKNKELELLKENQELIQTKTTESALSPKAVTILENEAFAIYGTNLFDYIQRQKFHTTIDTATNQIHQTVIPDDYYDFLQIMPMNEPSFLIPESAPFFINHLEMNNLNHRWTKYIKDKKTILKYDPKTRYESRDSVLLKDLQIPNSGLIYDITTTRWIKSQNHAVKISQENSNKLLSLASEKMTSPFIKTEAKKMVNNFFEKKEQGSYVLPDTPAAKLFRSLIASFKGKYIVVDFWDIYCGPCVSDIKQDRFVREELKGKDIDFLFICDESAPENRYNKFVKEQGLEHSVRLSYDQIKQMQDLFQFQAIPHYEYINREGNIMTTGLSMYNLEKTFKTLLEKEKEEKKEKQKTLDMNPSHQLDK